MRLPRLLAAGALVFALAASACGTDGASGDTDRSETASTEPTGESWPHTWVGDTIAGGQFAAGDLEGQDLVLWFWAPW